MVLPWYIAVQRRNPTFLQAVHRRAQSGAIRHQPLSTSSARLLLPGRADHRADPVDGPCPSERLVDALSRSPSRSGRCGDSPCVISATRARATAFPEFLVLWTLFPILFFSFSGSKLPGYILPSIPPLTILTGDYLYRSRRNGLAPWLLWAHGGAVRHHGVRAHPGAAAHEVQHPGPVHILAHYRRRRGHPHHPAGRAAHPNLRQPAGAQRHAGAGHREPYLPARLPWPANSM